MRSPFTFSKLIWLMEKEMDFEEIYKKAQEHNCFYFMTSQPARTDESEVLEVILHKLGLATAVTVIDKKMVALGARFIVNFKREVSTGYNKIIATSLAKCFNAKVIMGNGDAFPSIYSSNAAPQLLRTNDLIALLSNNIGQTVSGHIETASSHDAPDGFNAAIMRESFYSQARQFGDDVIATDIVSTAMLNNESSQWLDSIRKAITNKNAIAYLDEIANEAGNNKFDFDDDENSDENIENVKK